jgi:adenine-specific DNA methylase
MAAGKGKATGEQAPKACEECKQWKKLQHRLTISTVLADVVKKINEKLDSKEFKPTVSDAVRLWEIEREMESEDGGPKEVRVSWVEKKSKSKSGK